MPNEWRGSCTCTQWEAFVNKHPSIFITFAGVINCGCDANGDIVTAGINTTLTVPRSGPSLYRKVMPGYSVSHRYPLPMCTGTPIVFTDDTLIQVGPNLNYAGVGPNKNFNGFAVSFQVTNGFYQFFQGFSEDLFTPANSTLSPATYPFCIYGGTATLSW